MILRLQAIISKIKANTVSMRLSCIFSVFFLFLAADIVTFQDFSFNSSISYLILSALLFVVGALSPRYVSIPLYFLCLC